MTSQTQDAFAVGQTLVDLCNQGKNLEAINTLYADDVVSVEAFANPKVDMPREMVGIEAVRGKSEWWIANHEVHSGVTEGPYPHEDRFITRMTYDITPKVGPMAGQRMTMTEAGLYTVANGKIVREEFFYHMG